MNRIEKIFASTRRHFEKGGRLEKFWPIYESIESVFFAPATVSQFAPNIRDSLDVKRYMLLVIVALLPHYAFGIYNVGYQAHLAAGLPTDFGPVIWTGLRVVVPIVAVVYIFGFAWEALFASVRKHEMSEGVLVTCALLPLTLPPTIPLWQAAMGISFGVVIGKEIFGGTGRNFLNPALTGRAFLYFAYPVQNSGDAVWTYILNGGKSAVDAISGATPLSIAAVTESYGNVNAGLTDSGYTASKLFFGLYPGSIGGTATFLCIAGAIFLSYSGYRQFSDHPWLPGGASVCGSLSKSPCH